MKTYLSLLLSILIIYTLVFSFFSVSNHTASAYNDSVTTVDTGISGSGPPDFVAHVGGPLSTEMWLGFARGGMAVIDGNPLSPSYNKIIETISNFPFNPSTTLPTARSAGIYNSHNDHFYTTGCLGGSVVVYAINAQSKKIDKPPISTPAICTGFTNCAFSECFVGFQLRAYNPATGEVFAFSNGHQTSNPGLLDDRVLVIDTDKNAITQNIRLNINSLVDMAFDTATDQLYIQRGMGMAQIYILDGRPGSSTEYKVTLGPISIPFQNSNPCVPGPCDYGYWSITFNPHDGNLYLWDYGTVNIGDGIASCSSDAYLAVLDGHPGDVSYNTIVKTIPGLGCGGWKSDLTFSNTGNIYVIESALNIGTLNFCSETTGSVFKVDAKTSAVTKIPLPPPAKCPSGIAYNDATGDIYVANYALAAGFVGKILPNTFSVISTAQPVISNISTSIIDESTGVDVTGGRINAGTKIHDTATITTDLNTSGHLQFPAPTPTGYVNYTAFPDSFCSRFIPGEPEAHELTEKVLLSNSGAVLPSTSIVPTEGYHYGYSYRVTYSGDSNYSPFSSACERLKLGAPDIETRIMFGNTDVTGGKVDAGTQVHDTATIAGFKEGTVTYERFSNAECVGKHVDEDVSFTNGVVPPSSSVVISTPIGYKVHLDGMYFGGCEFVGINPPIG